MPVQSTFTKQKRELAKAKELIQSIRAEEVRTQRLDTQDNIQTEERSSYMVESPQEIASKVFTIINEIVSQHGARQKANASNRGHFVFAGIQADLTVPQLRAIQESVGTLTSLIEKLPAENLRLIPNGKLDGHPAFFSPMEEQKEQKVRYVPYEEDTSTRVRTYEEHYDVVLYKTRTVTINYGIQMKKIIQLREMLSDLGTAIQVAIDEANALPHEGDAELNRLIGEITAKFNAVIR